MLVIFTNQPFLSIYHAVVPLLQDKQSVRTLLSDSLLASESAIVNVNAMADLIVEQLGEVGCKTALRLAERAVASAAASVATTSSSSNDDDDDNQEQAQLDALAQILDDLSEIKSRPECSVR